MCPPGTRLFKENVPFPRITSYCCGFVPGTGVIVQTGAAAAAARCLK